MKEKLPGLFRPLMKFNVTAVMVIILMFSVFNVFPLSAHSSGRPACRRWP